MQENEFEKRVRLKMDELKLVPAEEVWTKVAFRIRKEKRRRKLLIFLLLFTILGGSTAVLYYTRSTITSKKVFHPISKKGVSKAPVPSTTAGSHSTPGNQAPVTVAGGRPSIQILERPLNKKSTAAVERMRYRGVRVFRSPVATLTVTKMEFHAAQKGQNRPGIDHLPDTKKTPSQLLHSPDQVLASNAINSSQTPFMRGQAPTDSTQQVPDTGQMMRQVIEKPAELNDPKIQQGTPAPTTIAADTISPALQASKTLQTPFVQLKNGWHFGTTAFAGLSNNLSGIRLLPSPAANYQYSSPGSGTANSGNQPVSKLQYSAGFSYGLGVFARRQLSKSTWFSAGVNYQNATAISVAGNPVNSTQTFFDAGLQYSSTVSAYYVAGQSARFTNRYQLFELPLQLLWQVNKKQKEPLFLMLGIVPSYLVNSQALYANLGQNVYYTDKSQFKKGQLAAQSGIEFPLIQQKHFHLSGGPQVQYGLTNLAKPATGTSQHLFFAGVKFCITL